MLQRFGWVAAHADGSGEVVSVAAGDKRERWAFCSANLHKAVCHFVHNAVAAECHHGAVSAAAFACYACSVLGAYCVAERKVLDSALFSA